MIPGFGGLAGLGGAPNLLGSALQQRAAFPATGDGVQYMPG